MNDTAHPYSPRTLAAQALGRIEPHTKAVVPPLHVSTTYLRDPDNAYRSGFAYGRPDNETVRHAESIVAALEGAKAALLFGAGMAAATAAIMALPPGRIIASQVMYWALRDWLVREAPRFGHSVDLVDTSDLDAVRAVRKALPSGVALMTDYNQGLDVAEAIRRGRALDGEGLYWIEEPVRAEDFAGAAQVAAAIATPVQIGENFQSPFEVERALAAGASDFVMLDAQQVGGVTGWLAGMALAAAAGKACSSHLFQEFSAHLLAVTPTAGWLEWFDIADPVLKEPLALANGMATAPERPGAGIDWDEMAVARYRLD